MLALFIHALLLMSSGDYGEAFPSPARSSHPVYTVKKIYDVYDSNSKELLKQPNAIRELLEMLVQV